MVWLNICRVILQQILPYSFAIPFRYLKTTSACQKYQTFEHEYSCSQTNLIYFSRKNLLRLENIKKVWFEKHDVARNELLELKVDDLYKAGLPFLVAKKLETQLMQLRKPFTFKLII
ncbi:hypothetical protein F8M41_000952 [Gigaspora margarita]|uniref:Uncharacterized protein n=1 Tax=Gigaspora margarita TaxID=4874 RepID=A0A8H3XF60_GIGMA|nr:hypothetical protein F8M41_000952 [Gigaspora margarita]